ncbi:EAL domain-containing protein [Erwinia sp. AnSW2-5]|uniref:EAL domain-containing protein n=1 Tax=Erwinia sp. AnSW2-5 TaxID=3367692 RepID=UPI00385ED942
MLNQLLIIEEYADYFRQHGLLCSVAIDFQLARAVTESSFIQQILSQLPFVRLKLSEDFPNLHDGMNNPLLRTLIEQLNIIWLDDLGAGDANLNALQSNMFEAVKLDRQFYLENVDKPFFTVLINHIRQYTNRVIVEGVAGDGQLDTLRHSKIWGVQGYFSPELTLENLEYNDGQRCENQ